MKRIISSIALSICIASIFLSSCATVPDTVTQVSTINAILAGAYDGQMSCGQLLSYGDFGIGTFDRLDGEMIVLDHKCYQVKADGKVYMPPMCKTTPFACVVKFKKDMTVTLMPGTNYRGLEETLKNAVPNMNLFCAVKVKGRFMKIKTRSVPAQNKPYPPLVDVTKRQPVFNLENISGTIVGFRSPYFAKGITVPGYHLHFISDDRKSGGHVLAFRLDWGTAEIDVCNKFLMILPENDSAFGKVDLSRDRSADMEKAERSAQK